MATNMSKQIFISFVECFGNIRRHRKSRKIRYRFSRLVWWAISYFDYAPKPCQESSRGAGHGERRTSVLRNRERRRGPQTLWACLDVMGQMRTTVHRSAFLVRFLLDFATGSFTEIRGLRSHMWTDPQLQPPDVKWSSVDPTYLARPETQKILPQLGRLMEYKATDWPYFAMKTCYYCNRDWRMSHIKNAVLALFFCSNIFERGQNFAIIRRSVVLRSRFVPMFIQLENIS